MSFTAINAELAKNQTQQSLICQAVNAWASREGIHQALITRAFVQAHSHSIHPDSEIIAVKLRCDGKIIRAREGKFAYDRHYSTRKKSNGFYGNISVTDTGDVMITPADGNTIYAGNIHELEVREPEWKEWIDPNVVVPQSGSMDVQEALTAIREATEALDPKLLSPFSHGGTRALAPSFVQTATEGAVAYAKTAAEHGDIFLPTFMRAKMPLPYGGIDGKTADKNGFTQEDKIQMKGNDFQRMSTTLKARSTPKLDGQTYDTKLISSVSSPFYTHIPVEAFRENLAKALNDPDKFIWEDKSLWTWSTKHTAEIVYVIRNKAYFVSKESLRLKVKEEVRKFKASGCVRTNTIKPNTIRKGDSYEQNKWCIYLSEDDILSISYQVLELPEFYGELMEKHAEDAMDFYASHKHGDDYVVWHLKNYAPNI